MPLRIRTAPSHNEHPDDLVEVPMLPLDHYPSVGAGAKSAFGTNLRLAQICVWRVREGLCVALDVYVSQARWQQLKNMSADALIGSIFSFPKVCNATFSGATKTS